MVTRYAPPFSSTVGAPAPRAPPSGCNVAVVSHAQYVKTAVTDLLTLKVVSESPVTWATSVSILVFLGLSVLNLGSMYATDARQTDVRQKHHLMSSPMRGRGIIITTMLFIFPSVLSHYWLGNKIKTFR